MAKQNRPTSSNPPMADSPPPTSPETVEVAIPKPAAVLACFSMAVFYVAVLYLPALLLRPPQATSPNQFWIRRFVCAALSSLLSALICALLLPAGRFSTWSAIFSVYGIQVDYMGRAVLFPFSLTSLLYTGTFLSKCLFVLSAREVNKLSFFTCKRLREKLYLIVSDVMAWRNYVVVRNLSLLVSGALNVSIRAPLTEEVVFRACMTPLLLCGGFKKYAVIFLSPIFFSLAHLNHFLELYWLQKYSFPRASLIVGFQLGYTIIFGWYACFLFIRTGQLLAPITAHALCNVMGLPRLSSPHGRGLVFMATVSGAIAFLFLLFPATNPKLYNYRTDSCRCWLGYCTW